ncbi:non-ribosomal peptide synthetase, partial [Tenacibaculum sp. M341]|uniref:non-ribosomal peptide synthetase n=2 Tax=Tenacibaculum TaxID=104267 RepID=UPI00104C1F01
MESSIVLNIIHKAKENGIKLFVDQGELKFRKKKEVKISSELINEIRLNKKQIIQFFRNDISEIKQDRNHVIKVATRPKKIPLSFSQERLWFIDKLQGTLNYHMPVILRFKEGINIDGINYAFKKLIERHEILRTVLKEEEGVGYQEIQTSDNFEVSYIETQEDKLESLIKGLMKIPFKLDSDYMLRANMLHIDEDDHMLVMIMHHIASDGWSMVILANEMLAFYKEYTEGVSVQFGDLSIQYADYAIWQRDYLNDEDLEKKLLFLENSLAGLEPLSLPTDFPRPMLQSTRGDYYKFQLDQQTTDQLVSLSKQHGGTLFIVLLSIYKILLYRYTGQKGICVGTPVANRSQEEISELIGFFVNSIALKSDVEGKSTYENYLKTLTDQTLKAFKYQDVPFEKVVQRIEKERDQSRSSLFQVMLTLQEEESNDFDREGGMESDNVLGYNNQFASLLYDLDLTALKWDTGLLISITYSTDLFEKSTIIKFAEHFQELTASILADPKRLIDELTILGKEEHNSIVNELGEGEIKKDYKDSSVLTLFETQVKQHPEAIAVRGENDVLTYKELGERSDSIAYYLYKKGLKKGTILPVYVEKSPLALVYMLGILKGGGVFAPINRLLPKERLAGILEELNAPWIFTSQACINELPKEYHKNIIDASFEKEFYNLENVETEKLPTVHGKDLAYVVYTSGTTGKSKGVKVNHESLCEKAYMWQELYGLDETTRLLQMANFSFDVFIGDFCRSLLFGGEMVLCKVENFTPEKLSEQVNKHQINIIEFTPGILVPFLDYTYTNSIALDSLKTVIIGSDILSLHDAKELKEKYGKTIQLYNSYGVTEATIDSACLLLNEYDFNNISNVPIGRPLSNTTLYVLDSCGNIVPRGVIGELYIGGSGVSEGYLNRATLTEERFVNNPFRKGEKMYRTGDSARWLPDGNIEFFGRKDNQIKLRGYRIELGEIINQVESHAGVDQSVVIVKGSGNDQYLVCYYTSASSLVASELEEYLQGVLP